MRLVTYAGHRVGKVVDGGIVDLTDELGSAAGSSGQSAMRTLIELWPSIADRAARRVGVVLPLAEAELEAPVPDPSKILAAPINYVDHQKEMSVESQVDGLGLFLKAPSSLLRPYGTVELPYYDRRFDQEGELAVLIGRPAYRLAEDEAASVIFGYTGLLDITMRGGEDRSTRKSFRTFTPLGPWIVTPEEFGDPAGTELRCWVNGTLRQEANTRDLIWGVNRLVWYASWISPLEPGDIVSTGTPAGVGPIGAGDVIELELSGLGGLLTVEVAATGAVASHTAGRDRGAPGPLPAGRTTSVL